MKINIFDTTKKYQIIYADPPWEYRQSGSKTKARGMAKQHYPTMSTDEIAALPIHDLATDSAILFLWATFPNIAQGLKVIAAWGFIYKTVGFVWVKKNKKSNTNFWGMGAYTRANAEVCLLGIRKETKAQQVIKSRAVHQIIESPIRKHSEKPAEARDKIIELLGDEVNKIELFAREQVAGWDCWGNEA